MSAIYEIDRKTSAIYEPKRRLRTAYFLSVFNPAWELTITSTDETEKADSHAYAPLSAFASWL
ncbi:hypothetical protein XACG102_11220002 [Xanthomonas citri pv. citri]|nr:hypothetical protein XACG102_11220002 [Xanthomonas citri pv. citri]